MHTSARAGRLVIPGVGALSWGAGAMRGAGTLLAQQVHVVDPPTAIEDVPFDGSRRRDRGRTDGVRIAAPLTLRLGHAGATQGSTLLAARLDDAGRWSLLRGGRPMPTGGMSITTARLSFVTWISGQILKPLGHFLASALARRTSPPPCAADPAGSSGEGILAGAIRSCVRTGPSLPDGTGIAELEITSIRGTYQWVQIPSTIPRVRAGRRPIRFHAGARPQGVPD